MTREEAIKLLRKLRETIDRNNAYGEAEEMGIQALEQEPCDVFDKYGNYKYPSDVELTEPNTATSMPCEDTISRQAVMDDLCDGCELYKNGEQTCFTKCEEYHFLATLPPVTPQPKDGKWIEDEYEMEVRCSACGEENDECSNYCPNCGAKMVEEQEGE